MANSFNFNDIDFSSYGLIVKSTNKTLLPPPRYEEIITPYEHGAIFSDTYYGPREISCDCVVIGSSNADLQTKLGQIESAITQFTDKTLILDSQPTRYYNARVANRINYTQSGTSTAFFSIDFVSKNPFAYSTTSSSDDNSIVSSHQTISVVSSGDTFSFPVILLTADDSIESPSFTHNDQETTLTWAGTMEIGDILKIECAPTDYKISQSLAASPEDFSRSTNTITGFFPIIDSGTNSITIHNFSGESNIAHTARFKG